jgi:Polyketide cyclase / dehydrase and lipid transport
MEFAPGLLVVLAAVFFLAVLFMPTNIQYRESIVISAPIQRVYDNVRYQEDLMNWSAWPSTTKSTCSVAGLDGQKGAQTVFFSKGKRFGHQELTDLAENKSATFTLESKGPPQKPVLTFLFEAVGKDQTKVTIDFSNQLSRPFNVLLRLFGIVRWTRQMHVKDLQGLKRYCEPPYLTYTGLQIPPRNRPVSV